MIRFSNLVRPTKRCLVGLVLLGLTSHIVRADLPRTPVTGVPRIFGREIERFVLLKPLSVDRSKPGVPFRSTIMVIMSPGTFIPVTEDAGGIFYQAVNGFLEIRGNKRTSGGVYVSKSRQGIIWVYVGHAGMGDKFGIDKDTLPLPASMVRHLNIGKTERKK